jgi:Fibronectin type III domain
VSRVPRRVRVGLGLVWVCFGIASFASGSAIGSVSPSGSAPSSSPHVKKVKLHGRYLKFLPKEKHHPIKPISGPHSQPGLAAAAASCAEPACPLLYQGGSVQGTPKVYLLFWGPLWSSTAPEFTYLQSFLGGLGQQPSDRWSVTMEQYGVSAGYPAFSGSVLRGVYQDTTTPPFGATQNQLAAEADALYSTLGLTDRINTQIVVATQSGTCPEGFAAPCNSGGYYCAWHSYSTVNTVPYTNLPYLLDGNCGENAVNAGSAGTYDGFSIVEGHEFAETVTDPFPDAGWFDTADPYGGEIGDKCSWRMLFDLALPTGTFAMQPLWSNRANVCAQTSSVSVPTAPVIGTATAGNAQATVSFSAPSNDGGATIQRYTVTAHDTANPASGGQTASGSGSLITVTGLVNGDTYTFTVTATNAVGTSTASAASNAVTPKASGGIPGKLNAQFVVVSTLSSDAAPTDPYSFSWSQGSCPTGATYTLKESVNSGSFVTVFTGTATSAKLSLAIGNLYTFQVSCGGSPSATTFRLNGYQETSAAYKGTWTTNSFTGAWGGTAVYSTASGASATFTCTCEAIAWVTDEGSNHGSASVYVDGVLKKTVNTQTSTNKNRVVVYKVGWASDGPHTLRIVNLATSGHPRVNVDGFLTRTQS